MENKVGHLILANKSVRHVAPLWSIKELGKLIMEINESFIASNMPSLVSVVSVYSEGENAAQQVS